jgi:hypothetical protein
VAGDVTDGGEVDAFLVIHAGLHTALRSHEDYTFHTTLSEVCIYGAAALGLIHAALSIRSAVYSSRAQPSR